MLKITTKNEPIEVRNLVACIYSPPGAGKTSIGFTAKNPILFDFDHGAYRSAFRSDVVEISTWQDVASITASDLKDYDTVVIDTVGRALDTLTVAVMAEHSKWRNNAGGLSQQGWGALKTKFNDWLKALLHMGKDVVLLAHATEQPMQGGDVVVNRLDIQGGTKNEVYKVSDLMGIIRFEGRQRILDFTPSDAGFGKNPAGLQPEPIPSFTDSPHYLADVLARTKDKLNALSEAAKAHQARVQREHEQISALQTLEDCNALLQAMKSPDALKASKAYLVKKAEELGFSFDKDTAQFVAARVEEEALA